MRNEIVAWTEQEQAEAREAALEQEWEDSGLAKLLPEPIQAGKLRPYELVYTHEQLVAAMMAAQKTEPPHTCNFTHPEYDG